MHESREAEQHTAVAEVHDDKLQREVIGTLLHHSAHSNNQHQNKINTTTFSSYKSNYSNSL
jgi:hypothetical protein